MDYHTENIEFKKKKLLPKQLNNLESFKKKKKVAAQLNFHILLVSNKALFLLLIETTGAQAHRFASRVHFFQIYTIMVTKQHALLALDHGPFARALVVSIIGLALTRHIAIVRISGRLGSQQPIGLAKTKTANGNTRDCLRRGRIRLVEQNLGRLGQRRWYGDARHATSGLSRTCGLGLARHLDPMAAILPARDQRARRAITIGLFADLDKSGHCERAAHAPAQLVALLLLLLVFLAEKLGHRELMLSGPGGPRLRALRLALSAGRAAAYLAGGRRAHIQIFLFVSALALCRRHHRLHAWRTLRVYRRYESSGQTLASGTSLLLRYAHIYALLHWLHAVRLTGH
ncbi:hypothetical protein BpHYR1_043582, partial [Brachionus plicatilis]